MKRNDIWYPTEKMFEDAQRRDVYKQYIALKMGYNMVRIDYSIPHKEIEKHIMKAFELNNKIYYSTPSLYTWLDNNFKNFIPNQ
jgi:hypothetical protein